MISKILKIGILLSLPFYFACSAVVKDASIHIYRDPTFSQGYVTSIAILPIESDSLKTHEIQRIERKIFKAINEKNPRLNILSAAEVGRILSKRDLYKDWDQFIENYLMYGRPDARMLSRIASSLKVKAIVHTGIEDIYRQDGQYRVRTAIARVHVKLSIFDLISGRLIWEGSSEGIEENELTFEVAPPLNGAVNIALETILANFPRF